MKAFFLPRITRIKGRINKTIELKYMSDSDTTKKMIRAGFNLRTLQKSCESLKTEDVILIMAIGEGGSIRSVVMENAEKHKYLSLKPENFSYESMEHVTFAEQAWLVFQCKEIPEFQGVFSSVVAAIAACVTESHCVCPAKMNQVVPLERTEWPGAWYPLQEAAVSARVFHDAD